jgi:two-component system NtrC family sensor kinase
VRWRLWSLDTEHSRVLFWHTLGRLLLLYFVPLLLLAGFFHLQYRELIGSSRRSHLEVTAEHHARLFDVFLRERIANLRNLAADPLFADAASNPQQLRLFLAHLQQTSDAFLDVGMVDWNGSLVAYAGPVHYGPAVNYRNEAWFQDLVSGRRNSVITDIYRGFRDQPHFTVAVLQGSGDRVRIVRAALSPEQLSGFLEELAANEVQCGVVNAAGVLQVTMPQLGAPLSRSPFAPPRQPWRGYQTAGAFGSRPEYAYGWLNEVDWALVATAAPGLAAATGVGRAGNLLLPTLTVFFLMGVVILVRTRQVVTSRLATEQHEADLSGQLVHAAKLASIGELAAGIAHEINNPLAIIAEEVGDLQDSLDPELSANDPQPVDLPDHLNAIHEAVFRCRDITRKLLTFVRQGDLRMARHPLHPILEEVLDMLLGHELMLSNIAVVRRYEERPIEVEVDRNQLVQVLVNLVKNAIDAMPGGGTLTVTTQLRAERVAMSVADTGCGMTPEQLARAFTPFFTTKDPGKGTGLGLSVSYMIIQHFDGTFHVDSVPGKGSTFTVDLPIASELTALAADVPGATEERRPWRNA